MSQSEIESITGMSQTERRRLMLERAAMQEAIEIIDSKKSQMAQKKIEKMTLTAYKKHLKQAMEYLN